MGQLEEFRALGLSEDILAAISAKGFETPSAIQNITIPRLLGTGSDIIAQAQTGTGKTAAFGLPVIQLLTENRQAPQALVLVPTRELALQVTQELQSFNTNRLSIAPIYGGASMEEQLRRLRKGIDIVVGTPGRILDHVRRRTLDLSGIAYLVLDEADEMLNMGFIEDIEAIMQETTSPKRVFLFSATIPARIASLARNYMREPEILRVESKNITTDLTNQIYFEVREGDKFDALTRIIDVEPEFYGIVFSRTKVGVDEIVNKLIERGYAAEGLHGDISQAQREKILGKFKKKQINILIATDVAARGIDVNNLTHVLNYSLPQDSDSYVHRIGRTGRAGNHGTAITFISPSEMRQFGFLKRNIKADIKLERLPTPADVIATKRNKIKEELYGIVESENYRECEAMAAELLESYSPEVALSALLRLAFKDELNENSYPEIRSINVDRRGKARIFIAVGTRDGFDPRKMVKLLKRECGLSDHDLDDVKVMEDFSFATVPFDRANRVVKELNMLSDGRPIAEIAKERPQEEAPARGGRKREPAPAKEKKSREYASAEPNRRGRTSTEPGGGRGTKYAEPDGGKGTKRAEPGSGQEAAYTYDDWDGKPVHDGWDKKAAPSHGGWDKKAAPSHGGWDKKAAHTYDDWDGKPVHDGWDKKAAPSHDGWDKKPADDYVYSEPHSAKKKKAKGSAAIAKPKKAKGSAAAAKPKRKSVKLAPKSSRRERRDKSNRR